MGQSLREAILLKDGRRLATVADVQELMLELSDDHQADPHWRLTQTLLISVHQEPTHATLRSLQEQLCRSLAFERML